MTPTLPTHDETTGRVLLQKEQLADGAYYIGRCRNATLARWNAAENQFYHWREKFTRIYIETIKMAVDEPQFDVFRPVRLDEKPPFAIPFQKDAEWQGDDTLLSVYNREMWCSCDLAGTCHQCKFHNARVK